MDIHEERKHILPIKMPYCIPKAFDYGQFWQPLYDHVIL